MIFRQIISLFLMVGLATGCQPTFQKIEPILNCPLPTHRISSMPSAFPAFADEESNQEWSKELLMGDVFAKECDFYRAITCYKRALILLPFEETERRLQLTYNLALCYYLGGKYEETIALFEATELSQVSPQFWAFNNLLLMVYDAYLQVNQEDKAECALKAIQKFSPETGEDLSLYQHLKHGEIAAAQEIMAEHREKESMQKDFAFYEQFSKSPKKARFLNAILPGAGYYYVGQRRSALTSFIINALFTLASYQFFRNGYVGAGAITASLEMGWYVGGINGAGIEAQEFNNRLFEGVSRKILNDHACFPILMFETSF